MTSSPFRATVPLESQSRSLARAAKFENLRALAWSGEYLYASRGYRLLRAKLPREKVEALHLTWEFVAFYKPELWRRVSSTTRLGSRLVRDGFHALTVLQSGGCVAAVPGAIIARSAGQTRFRRSYKITRGMRPLHLTAVPGGAIFWGEYFDNPLRGEVHIYASADDGLTWNVAYTFPKGSIRHVHNIVFDPWGNCLWILTGDHGDECRILRASCDLSRVEDVLKGNQQARAVALVPCEEGVYFSSDTPLEANYIYRLNRQGGLSQLVPINSSSICGCCVSGNIFFSTMVEPSAINLDRHVQVYGSCDGKNWQELLQWKKDLWPMGLFQYGNAQLPDGNNETQWLAVSTVAVESDDMSTSFYFVD
jgi:hypothetical protein